MKPAEARRLASERTLQELSAAAEVIGEEQSPPFEVAGDEPGDKLTHVLLAIRIRKKMDEEGKSLVDAFREVMAGVRGVLTND